MMPLLYGLSLEVEKILLFSAADDAIHLNDAQKKNEFLWFRKESGSTEWIRNYLFTKISKRNNIRISEMDTQTDEKISRHLIFKITHQTASKCVCLIIHNNLVDYSVWSLNAKCNGWHNNRCYSNSSEMRFYNSHSTSMVFGNIRCSPCFWYHFMCCIGFRGANSVY